jgi:rubrerythrin
MSRRAAKETAVPASPDKPDKRKRERQQMNKVEAAASNAAREIAELAQSTEPTPTRLPDGLLQRRLEKSNTDIEKLQKEEADMEKRMAILIEEAVKISKVVESASPGAVVHVGRQVISYLFPFVFPCQNCNFLFAEGEGSNKNSTFSPRPSPNPYVVSFRILWL